MFLPGLLWARMHRAFVSKRETTTVDFFVNAFFFGLVCYALTFGVYAVLREPFVILAVQDANAKLVITPQIAREVAVALGLAPVCAVIDMYAANKRWLVSALQKIGATKRYGYEDIWDYTLNTNSRRVLYAQVRDFTKELNFSGWIEAFSESERARELLLREVRVTDFEGQFLYETPLMYVAGSADQFHIEFPTAEDADGDAA